MIRLRSAAAILATLATTALATPTNVPLAPVAGGLSDRLAPLGSFIESKPTDFRANLAGQLDQARTQTHELIDKIIDEGGLKDFLEAMSEEGEAENELAKSLASADPERARAVLHSKVERQLADFGRTIQQGLGNEEPTRLKASFDLAMRDLAREENHLMETLEDEAPGAPISSDLGVDHEELGEPPTAEGPAAPQGMGPAAPDGRRGRRGRRGGDRGRGFQNAGRGNHRGNGHAGRGNRRGNGHAHRGGRGRQVHQTQRQVRRTQRQVQRTQQQLRQTQRQLRQTQRRVNHNQMAMQMRRQRRHAARQQNRYRRQQDMMRAQRRAYAQSSRAAWLNTQARASAWNARCQGFPTYNYRAGYNRRYSRPFPTGYYYRPDRVERVVRRGLWGVATVAATPFALLASVF